MNISLPATDLPPVVGFVVTPLGVIPVTSDEESEAAETNFNPVDLDNFKVFQQELNAEREADLEG